VGGLDEVARMSTHGGAVFLCCVLCVVCCVLCVVCCVLCVVCCVLCVVCCVLCVVSSPPSLLALASLFPLVLYELLSLAAERDVLLRIHHAQSPTDGVSVYTRVTGRASK
jgi:hypothetical protein